MFSAGDGPHQQIHISKSCNCLIPSLNCQVVGHVVTPYTWLDKWPPLSFISKMQRAANVKITGPNNNSIGILDF